ncbi:hypothetical protein D3C87_1818550 [compost metagenome]
MQPIQLCQHGFAHTLAWAEVVALPPAMRFVATLAQEGAQQGRGAIAGHQPRQYQYRMTVAARGTR